MAAISVEWAPVALRVMLGVIFIVHGYPKLKNLQGTAGFLGSQGFKPAMFWALVLGLTEFVGGVAILIGLASRVAAALLIVSMVVASFLQIFKWKTPLKKPDGGAGYEFDLLIIAALIALLLLGSGNLSVDQLMGWMLG